MRFISEDTYKGDVKDPLSLNLYTYCQGNPVRYFDYSGNNLDYDPMGLMSNSNTISTAFMGGGVPENIDEYISVFVSFAPGIGDVKDLQEAVTGGDIFTGERISTGGRIFTLALAFVPVVNGKAARAIFTDPWIAKSTYSFITKKYGKDAAQEFVKIMQKGFVGKSAKEGIKKLTLAQKLNGITYTHEIKILEGSMKNYRIYGYFDEEAGQYIFDWFGDALHK